METAHVDRFIGDCLTRAPDAMFEVRAIQTVYNSWAQQRPEVTKLSRRALLRELEARGFRHDGAFVLRRP